MAQKKVGLRKILFICVGNSARSIMAEAVMNHFGRGQYQAFSAGAKPSGQVNPLTIEILKAKGVPVDGLRSKLIEEFLDKDLDTVITVCDNARESCPVWPGKTRVLHWNFPDPAAFKGTSKDKREFFDKIYEEIKRGILIFLAT